MGIRRNLNLTDVKLQNNMELDYPIQWALH